MSDKQPVMTCTVSSQQFLASQMMIDVKDYKPGDITVKTVDDTVVVEGKIEQKEGNSIKTQVFTRRFMLPPTVNLNGVTSALSRDGVLTISAPKLVRPLPLSLLLLCS
uniref:SHSP domain-containing protein n=1 Tax=Scylla olivacea TaxID=85551 RepID=A0A0P4W4K4_SCYOL